MTKCRAGFATAFKANYCLEKCNTHQLEDYANTSENCIDQLAYETANEMTKPNIDTFVQELSNAIVTSSNKLPKLQYKKHIKPYIGTTS